MQGNMSTKHRESAIKRWANTPIEVRRAKGRAMAIAKHEQMSDKERSEHARKMSLAKKEKSEK